MKILYFASLKESLKLSSEVLTATDGFDVVQLRNILIEKYGKQHFPDNILCAVNHKIATDNTPLGNTDEVAFYPPVSGG